VFSSLYFLSKIKLNESYHINLRYYASDSRLIYMLIFNWLIYLIRDQLSKALNIIDYSLFLAYLYSIISLFTVNLDNSLFQ